MTVGAAPVAVVGQNPVPHANTEKVAALVKAAKRVDEVVAAIKAAIERGIVQKVTHPRLGEIPVVGTPLKFDLARQVTAALAYIALADLDRIAVCGGVGHRRPGRDVRRVVARHVRDDEREHRRARRDFILHLLAQPSGNGNSVLGALRRRPAKLRITSGLLLVVLLARGLLGALVRTLFCALVAGLVAFFDPLGAASIAAATRLTTAPGGR